MYFQRESEGNENEACNKTEYYSSHKPVCLLCICVVLCVCVPLSLCNVNKRSCFLHWHDYCLHVCVWEWKRERQRVCERKCYRLQVCTTTLLNCSGLCVRPTTLHFQKSWQVVKFCQGDLEVIWRSVL